MEKETEVRVFDLTNIKEEDMPEVVVIADGITKQDFGGMCIIGSDGGNFTEWSLDTFMKVKADLLMAYEHDLYHTDNNAYHVIKTRYSDFVSHEVNARNVILPMLGKAAIKAIQNNDKLRKALIDGLSHCLMENGIKYAIFGEDSCEWVIDEENDYWEVSLSAIYYDGDKSERGVGFDGDIFTGEGKEPYYCVGNASW